MKTISLELSKRLSPYLKDIKTEFILHQLPNTKKDGWLKEQVKKTYPGKGRSFKTLSLEEAIEFLPKTIRDGDIYGLQINWQSNSEFGIRYNNYAIRKNIHLNQGKTLLESIESMLEYLLDNNLLGRN